MKVVQMGLKLSVHPSEYRQAAEAVASLLTGAPGLSGKLLFLNAEAGVSGAVCLFEDELSRDDFLAGPVMLQIREAPFHRGLEIKLFDLLPDAAAAADAADRYTTHEKPGVTT